MTESKSEIVFEALPEDDPLQRQPDISLAKAELGWKPLVPSSISSRKHSV